jgi:hypothetical protein
VSVRNAGRCLAWRGMVAWRAALAIVANYALCALLAAMMGRLAPRLGVARIEAAAMGDMLAILLLPVVPVFVFAARSPWKPTWVMAGAMAGLGAVFWTAGARP